MLRTPLLPCGPIYTSLSQFVHGNTGLLRSSTAQTHPKDPTTESIPVIQLRPDRHPLHPLERDMRLVPRIPVQRTARVRRASRENVVLHVRPDSQPIKANLAFPCGDCDIPGSRARRVHSRSQGEAVVDEDLDQRAVDEDVEVENFGSSVEGVGLEEAVEGGFCEVWG
jgi:hypothetical protein